MKYVGPDPSDQRRRSWYSVFAPVVDAGGLVVMFGGLTRSWLRGSPTQLLSVVFRVELFKSPQRAARPGSGVGVLAVRSVAAGWFGC